MIKKIAIFILFISLVSCQYFQKQVPDEKQLLEQELKKINWDEVDEFPSVLQCDTIKDAEIKRQCFFDYITQTIQERIGIDTLRIEYPEIDTINVKITVKPDSSLQFETQYQNDSIPLADKTKIDSILTSRLSDFPKVEPAIKRGVKVKTQFVLPVIIKMEK
ncbi:hypothetical protein [Flavobacterium sp.]|uniref:hypothetical protein n=1 Tax=Flavobacterium sp. TaxID=239 RepID=UPI004047986B